MATEDRMIRFIELLTKGTVEGKASWTPGSKSSFVLAQRAGAVHVGSRDADGQWPYHLLIFDDKGVTLESLATSGPDPEEESTPYDMPLRNLYAAARSNALNIDGVVSGILRELGMSKSEISSVVGSNVPGAFDPDEIPF